MAGKDSFWKFDCKCKYRIGEYFSSILLNKTEKAYATFAILQTFYIFLKTSNSPEKKKWAFKLLLFSARLASLQHSSATADAQQSQNFFLRFCDRPLSNGGARGGRSRAVNLPVVQKNTKF